MEDLDRREYISIASKRSRREAASLRFAFLTEKQRQMVAENKIHGLAKFTVPFVTSSGVHSRSVAVG